LPPVIKDEDKKILNEYYKRDIGKGYAFSSDHWTDNILIISLQDVIRQKDPMFINSLSAARLGIPSGVGYLNANTARHEIENAIWLYSTNKDVFARNKSNAR